jgi:PEP-CTERM motif
VEGKMQNRVKKPVQIMTVVATWCFSGSAFAIPFTLADSWLDLRDVDPGLVLNYEALIPDGTTYNLNVGDTYMANAFKIWTNETAVNGDDTTAYGITAYFDWSSPVADAQINGISRGIRTGFFGLLQYGKISWGGPVSVDFGNGGNFMLGLRNTNFNGGLFGLRGGYGRAGIVGVRQRLNSVSVPEPGTLALFGLGLIAIGFARRKKRT